MAQFNLNEARSDLFRLVERAVAGEEIVITKNGRPLARLVPLAPQRAPREIGFLAGLVRVGPDFDAPLPYDVRCLFDGIDQQGPCSKITP